MVSKPIQLCALLSVTTCTFIFIDGSKNFDSTVKRKHEGKFASVIKFNYTYIFYQLHVLTLYVTLLKLQLFVLVKFTVNNFFLNLNYNVNYEAISC